MAVGNGKQKSTSIRSSVRHIRVIVRVCILSEVPGMAIDSAICIFSIRISKWVSIVAVAVVIVVAVVWSAVVVSIRAVSIQRNACAFRCGSIRILVFGIYSVDQILTNLPVLCHGQHGSTRIHNINVPDVHPQHNISTFPSCPSIPKSPTVARRNRTPITSCTDTSIRRAVLLVAGL